MDPNPYSAPIPSSGGNPNSSNDGAVSAAAVQQLAATKPWVRFMAVITFIGAGFMLLAAAIMAVMGMVGGTSKSSAAFPFTGAMGIGIAALYAVFSVVYIFPGVKLWKYANAIALLIQSGRDVDLIEALNQQRSFWKFVGILVLATLVLYVVAILGFAVFAGFAAASRH